jgi:MoxR-like ATPase
MFNINVGYPTEDEEFQIVRLTTMGRTPSSSTCSAATSDALQEIVRKVPVADHVIRYALQFSRLTRGARGNVPTFVNEFVGWGAGPRPANI